MLVEPEPEEPLPDEEPFDVEPFPDRFIVPVFDEPLCIAFEPDVLPVEPEPLRMEPDPDDPEFMVEPEVDEPVEPEPVVELLPDRPEFPVLRLLLLLPPCWAITEPASSKATDSIAIVFFIVETLCLSRHRIVNLSTLCIYVGLLKCTKKEVTAKLDFLKINSR
ncbi:hypothetical protein [Spirosoma fluminis]